MLGAVHAANVTHPDQVLYRLFDAVVDSYLPILDGYDDQIADLQDRVPDDPTPASLAEIFKIKRALVDVRRVLTNTRDIATHLQPTESNLIAATWRRSSAMCMTTLRETWTWLKPSAIY